MSNQITLANYFELKGVSLHSGIATSMMFHPAPPHSGIVFRRIDVQPFEIIKAQVKNVSNTERCTQIKNQNGYSISMIEHVMSALRGMGVDNVTIDVHGEEIPVLDGSALVISSRIVEAGLLEQKAEKTTLRLKKIVRVEAGSSFLEALPSDRHSYSIGFKNEHNLPFLTDQTAYYDGSVHSYLHDIAPARTFGYENEITYLTDKGLIKGASLENAILIGESKVISELRYPDEFARHKLLDVVGDLALLPPFLAKVNGERTSHYLNNLFAQEVLNNLY